MKKKALLATITLILATSSWGVQAQSMTVSPGFQLPEAGLNTDLQNLQFEEIPAVKNTVKADASQQLKDFVRNVKSASGQFAQQTTGSGAQTGSFGFERPGKFYWNVATPYEQQVISDGKIVYQYDPDLMQVTQRPVDQAVGASPAAILFGSGSLDESFNVSVLPEQNGLVWLRATPKVPDAGLSHVDIAFANNLPAELVILDSFGQTTSIKMRNFKANAKIPASQFQFKAPAGVDTVRM